MNKQKIIAVVGPTASGKTELSVSLAERLGGEIISCDSMQIYKNMDIGTAKPTVEEMRGVPHHLFGFVEPSRPFSCADYKPLAEEAIRTVASRGRTPVLCGGTGLYLDSVISVSSFSPEIDESIRKELLALSKEELWSELLRVDPDSAEKTHMNNVKRVARALEIYRGTGRTKTEWDRLSKSVEPPYDSLVFGLDYRDRDRLYERINKRVDIMLENGLLDEVKSLDLPRDCNAAQAIGYKELYLYLDGDAAYEDAVALLKQNTRNYAKRQLTWFRKNKNVIWFYRDEASDEEIFKNIVNIAKKHLIQE